jgi:hypothetical protein
MAFAYKAIDAVIKQVCSGSVCQTGFTFVSSGLTALTLSEILDFRTYFEFDFIPVLNAVQTDNVQNVSVYYQGRGEAVPTYSGPLAGGGTATTPGGAPNNMPPEFNYWLRFGVSETYESISGDLDIFHPIKRGGAFIVGTSDSYLFSGIFGVPETEVDAWADVQTELTTNHVTGGVTWTPSVLGEEIEEGTGWRQASIEAALPIRITRLRSRLAV